MTLKQVKSMGTEGRNEEVGKKEVPAPVPEKIYASVQFAIDMIENLTLLNEVKEPEIEDPAILGIE